jgi:hypothetical protein
LYPENGSVQYDRDVMATPTRVLVTGAYRSGTTLVEKMLHRHPRVSVLSQPLPLLYVDVMNAFLAGIHRSGNPYPLGPRFLDRRYEDEQFAEFTREYVIPAERLSAVADAQAAYSGAWTPEAGRALVRVGTAPLAPVVSRVTDRVVDELRLPGSAVIGSKEILVEEYIPYFIEVGTKVVLVVRDPRAMIAPLVLGEGERYGGSPRPTLFHVRNWRKSVAYALAFRGDDLRLIRYEDLVADPFAINTILTWLGVEPLNAGSLTELRDQYGSIWQGNSSFSVPGGTGWRDLVDPFTIRYIEVCTFPELMALGYPTSVGHFDETAMLTHREPRKILRPEFPSGYGHRHRDVSEEQTRADLLKYGTSDPRAVRDYFLFEKTFDELRKVCAHGASLGEHSAGSDPGWS